jgi:Polysaccharide lyase family 4, domain II
MQAVDIMSEPLSMENEAGGLGLRIAFTVGRVTGSVGDAGGVAAAGSLVTLIPDESRRQRSDFYFNTTADLNGAFAFNNVPAGDYQLFAWEQIPPGAYQSSEFRHPFEARGRSIQVENGGTVSAKVNVIPAPN